MVSKKMRKILDVYEQEDTSTKLLARRGGGGGEVGRTLDQVDNLDFDTEIAPEDDEDIDDDEAFNEEDEERYGMHFEKAQESESEEDEEEEYMDISDMLDQVNKTEAIASQLMPREMSDDDLELEEEEEPMSLNALVEQPKQMRKRKRLETTHGTEESEFQIQSKSKLGFSDLIGLDEEANFGQLKKQLQVLDSEEAKRVDVPLPMRQQEKMSREVAYDESKKMISRWTNLVKKNREADQLAFPMNEPAPQVLSSGALVGKFAPENDFEKEINQMLIETGMTEEQQKEAEELELNKLSVEEVKQRRQELAKMRSLLFFQEQKQKKIAKIKSKTYRKLLKKKQQKEIDIEEMAKVNPEQAQKMREKLEFERIKERMSLKHKNKGKWAKSLLGRDRNDEGSQKAIAEQLQKHEQLTRKIKDLDSEESDADIELEPVQSAFESLDQMEDQEISTKGIMGMKFMQKAQERQKQETRKQVERAKRELEAFERGESYESDEEQIAGRHQFVPTEMDLSNVEDVVVEKNVEVKSKRIQVMQPLFQVESFEQPEHSFVGDANRFRSFHPDRPSAQKSIQESEQLSDKSAQETDRQSDKIEKPVERQSEKPVQRQLEKQAESETEENPWLDSTDVVKKSISEQKHITKQEKASAKFKKARKENQESDQEDVELLVEPEKKKIWKASYDDSDEDSLPDNAMQPAEQLSSYDIMKMAFANDDIQAEFDQEKDDIVNEDAPKAEDVTLPGWGDWSGPGTKKSKRKVIIPPKPGQGIESSKRQDAKLKHVIISEKRQKKAAKFMLPQVPFGYGSREQYERVIAAPLGKEWNAVETFASMTAPKVKTKQGSIINPLKFTKN
ncbi:small-subunit processome [Gorgonomyces haynaldii]|nr:small-subunit processome [Gorgonomyces haynaldii]